MSRLEGLSPLLQWHASNHSDMRYDAPHAVASLKPSFPSFFLSAPTGILLQDPLVASFFPPVCRISYNLIPRHRLFDGVQPPPTVEMLLVPLPDDIVAPLLSRLVAGIVLQRHVLDFFRIMGLAPPDAMSVRCERRQYLDREGRVTRKEDHTQRMTSWSVLYKALKDAFPADRCVPPND